MRRPFGGAELDATPIWIAGEFAFAPIFVWPSVSRKGLDADDQSVDPPRPAGAADA